MEQTVECWLAEIARAIVDKPEQVRVRRVGGDRCVLIEISVAKEDIGKIIGKKGRTIGAIRTILVAVREQKYRRYILELLDDHGYRRD